MKAKVVLILLFWTGFLVGQDQSVNTQLEEANDLLVNGYADRADSIYTILERSSNNYSSLDRNRILALKGEILRKKNRLNEADSLLQLTIKVFEKLDAPLELAASLRQQAYALIDLGAYDKALNCLTKANNVLEKLEANEELAKVKIAISALYQELEDDENQEKALNEALVLLEDTDNDYLKTAAYFNLANYYYLFEGMEDKVLSYLDLAKNYSKDLGNPFLQIKIEELDLIMMLDIGGDRKIIKEKYENLIRNATSQQDSFLIAETYYHYAIFESKDLFKSDTSYPTLNDKNKPIVDRSFELIASADCYLPKSHRFSILKIEILDLASDLKYLQGDYLQSSSYLKEALQIDSELDRDDNVNRTSFKSNFELYKTDELLKEQTHSANLWKGIGGAGFAAVALLLGLLFYARKANQAEHKSLKLKLLGDFMQSFDQEKEQFQKEERKRISKTLHDKVSSQLAAIKWLFESKVDDLEQNKLESGGLNSIMKMIEDAYSETRKISKEIETEGPTTRILALRKKLANIQDNDRLKLDVQIEGFAGKSIQYYIEDHISAIVMEMMANTFKYARNASQLKIKILREEDAIQLHISDDGAGFDIEEKKNGHGIRNIHDRIEAMNGQIQFDAKKGVGVRLDALIPLE